MSLDSAVLTKDVMSSGVPQSGVVSNHELGTDRKKSIFVFDKDDPMKFYIAPDEAERETYKSKIVECGGDVVDYLDNNTGVVWLSSVNRRGNITFDFRFVDDSIENLGPVDLTQYRNGSTSTEVATTNEPQPLTINFADYFRRSGKRQKYTFSDEQDEYILKHVRLNPRLRTSHSFFTDLAKHPALKGHTGESIRSRYRSRLEPKLNYVYKSAEDGTLIRDARGKLVRESLENMPKTIRSRFTAVEDYILCKKIVEHCRTKFNEDSNANAGERSGDGNRKDFDPYGDLTVPLPFFTSLTNEYPSRTFHSWRDRYRKFVRQYGAQRYIDYYNSCVREGREPEIISNLPRSHTSYASSMKNLIGSAYQNDSENQGYHLEDDTALDEEIGEVKSSNIDDALQDKPSIAGKDTAETQKGRNYGRRGKREINTGSPTTAGKPRFSSQPSEDDLVIDICYVPSKVSYEDLFNDNFYKIQPEQVISEVEKILNESQDHDLQYLFGAFSDIGITDVFTAHILMCTCADIPRILLFINKFLNMLPYVKEDEISNALNIEGSNGLWTAEYDRLLLDGSDSGMKTIRQVHDEESIYNRKKFLEKLSEL
ncbi:Piso0_003499 [Millerozyma farinosa CBS 7064]|uniref:DNA-binding protein RAP1 n=1 Tax=Pichia sorbitophila (strain ATCC MYA-4447 / BCRC 22081 / CBS 7064 / NBRC 10061 / NRRL Y-12695) TaxID=559304 RepID=G8YI96_PICSO|nr:Piso0_003499 [Millerozyma farinosa CBS 7064]CCE81148.1 Piso0_003499 [Millerozyma farinosa CBS 7064]